MDFDLRRVAAVRVETSQGVSTGSGFLITDSLVLTGSGLFGVTRVPDADITVSVGPDPRGHACEVAWSAPEDSRANGPVLLRITDSAWIPLRGAAVRWGRWAVARERPSCEIAGSVSSVSPDPADGTAPQWPTGTLLIPVFGSDQAVVELDHHLEEPLAESQPDAAAHGQLVGSAVFCDGLLVGAVDAVGERAGLLSYTPTSRFAGLPGFARLLRDATGQPPRLESCELNEIAPPWQPARTPADLLRPEQAIVTFDEGSGALARLLAWSTSPADAAIIAVTGPRGCGKTRLGYELASRLDEGGWVTGFVSSRGRPDAVRRLLTDTTENLLLIIDDVETRDDLDSLTTLLVNRPTTRRLRVIFLAREIGSWWRDLAIAADNAVVDLVAVSLYEDDSRLNASAERLREAATELATALAALPDIEQPHEQSDIWTAVRGMAGRETASQATTQQALLAELLRTHADSDTRDIDVLLHQERRCWTESARHCEFDPGMGVDAAVAVVHLVGTDFVHGEAGLISLLCRDGQGGSPTTERLNRWLEDLSPGSTRDGSRGLLSRAVADEHLGRTMDRQLLDNVLFALSPAGVERAVSVLARACDPVTETGRALTRALTAAAVARPQALGPALAAVTSRLRQAEPFVSALEEVVERTEPDPALLNRIARHLPRPAGPLRRAAVNVHSRLADLYRAAVAGGDSASRAALAAHLLILADRLAQDGPTPQSAELAREAIALCRELARQDPGVHLASEARALLAAAGALEPEQALAAVTQASTIFEELAADDTAAFSPEFARARRLLAGRLASAGHAEEAAERISEAAAVFGLLRRGKPEDFSAETAAALRERAAMLDAAGHTAAAVAASEEAVSCYQQLAQLRPPVFSPQWAAATTELSRRLADEGERERALQAAETATAVYRRLHRSNPRGYLRELAGSLLRLSDRLGDLGLIDDAFARAREAVQYSRLGFDEDPHAAVDLAESLLTDTVRVAALGQWSASLESANESVELFRRLVASDRAYSAGLAAALTNQACALGELGLPKKSAQSAGEAVELHRRLQSAGDGSGAAGLCPALTDLAVALSESGQGDNATAAADEAVRVASGLRDASSDGSAIAAARLTLSRRLAADGRTDTSLQVARQATTSFVGLLTEGGWDRRSRSSRTLSAALDQNLTERLIEARLFDEALAVSLRVVTDLRQLAVERPAMFRIRLAEALVSLSQVKASLQLFEDSAACAREAAGIYRLAAGTDPDGFQLEYLRALHLLAGRLAASTEPRQADAVVAEAVDAHRRASVERPEQHVAEVAAILRDHAARLRRAADPRSVSTARQSVALLRRLPSPLPAGTMAQLASSLAILSLCLHTERYYAQSVAPAEEVVAARRAIDRDLGGTPRSRGMLAASLRELAARLDAANEPNTARLAALDEAVSIYREIAATRASVTRQLAHSLLDQSDALSTLGYRKRARDSAYEAIRLYRDLIRDEPRHDPENLAQALELLSRLTPAWRRTEVKELRMAAAAARNGEVVGPARSTASV